MTALSCPASLLHFSGKCTPTGSWEPSFPLSLGCSGWGSFLFLFPVWPHILGLAPPVISALETRDQGLGMSPKSRQWDSIHGLLCEEFGKEVLFPLSCPSEKDDGIRTPKHPLLNLGSTWSSRERLSWWCYLSATSSLLTLEYSVIGADAFSLVLVFYRGKKNSYPKIDHLSHLKIYSTVVLTLCTLCDRFLEVFHLANLKLDIQWTATPPFPSLQTLATTMLCSVPESLTI